MSTEIIKVLLRHGAAFLFAPIALFFLLFFLIVVLFCPKDCYLTSPQFQRKLEFFCPKTILDTREADHRDSKLVRDYMFLWVAAIILYCGPSALTWILQLIM